MKIALVILHADPRRGGAERYSVDLAHGLARRGHGVSIIASTFANAADTPKPGDASNPSAIELRTVGLTRSRQYRSFLDSLDKHLAENPYDIVHAMLPVRRCDVYHPHAGMATDATRRGSIFKRLQNLTNRRGVYANIESLLLESDSTPIVIALSDYVKQSIRAAYPSLPTHRLATLFNAVDLDRFQISPVHASGITRALMVAQDFERKGLSEAIKATAKVPQLHLTVVGREQTTQWENLAKQLNIVDRVHFAGPTSDVHSFYAGADFFVLPTRHDPCSLVVLEALACGLPESSWCASARKQPPAWCS